MEFGQVVQEEILYKEKVYTQRTDGRTDDGQRLITIAHLQP